MSELLVYPGQALKVVDPGEGDDALLAEGYAVVFTDEKRHDLSEAKDYFNRETDYGLLSDKGEASYPSFFDHGADKTIGTERLGWVEAKVDDVGVWVRHVIKRRKDYIRKVVEAYGEERLALGQSSGAVPRDVRREKKGAGVHWITSWPIWEVSLTPEPAEPSTFATIKSVASGLSLPDESTDWNAPDWDAALSAIKAAREETAITNALRHARGAFC